LTPIEAQATPQSGDDYKAYDDYRDRVGLPEKSPGPLLRALQPWVAKHPRVAATVLLGFGVLAVAGAVVLLWFTSRRGASAQAGLDPNALFLFFLTLVVGAGVVAFVAVRRGRTPRGRRRSGTSPGAGAAKDD
jgi:hypothetical protein